MEQKPSIKTIEVIDSRTGHACKVACMSCIRGHRTTSCGKNVCRTKVFWTVKRPGRPANACTCPLGSTGRCQCVIATSACTHRAKKGEGRSVECRCDEQGRWCCVLEPDHWKALALGQNPKVDFYPSPEEMNAARIASTNATPSFPSTPSFSAGTPQTMTSLPTTPDPGSGTHFTNMTMSPFNNFTNYYSPQYKTPRFGLMGVGTPLGNEGHIGEDTLKWQGQAPQAPRELQPYSGFNITDPTAVPNPAPLDSAPNAQLPYIGPVDQQYPNLDFAPVTQSLEDMSVQTQQTPAEQLQRDKLMEDYYNYQFPSAICQNCGLSGCNCRNCPAVMQSSVDGSWAQCCSRKHVRTAELAQRGITHSSVALEHQDIPPLPQTGNPPFASDGRAFGIGGLLPGGDQPFSPDFNLDELGLPSGSDPMDFSEFVMTDPELPSHGCCCGGDT